MKYLSLLLLSFVSLSAGAFGSCESEQSALNSCLANVNVHPACVLDSDCGAGQECVAGVCRKSTSCTWVTINEEEVNGECYITSDANGSCNGRWFTVTHYLTDRNTCTGEIRKNYYYTHKCC